MNVTPRTLATSAAVILAGLVAWSALSEGSLFALGVGVSGLLVLANLGLWVWVVRAAIDAVTAAPGNPGGGAALLGVITVLKMFLLFAGVFALFQVFPPAAIALGLSSVVAGVLGLGLVGLVTDLQVGEA